MLMLNFLEISNMLPKLTRRDRTMLMLNLDANRLLNVDISGRDRTMLMLNYFNLLRMDLKDKGETVQC